MTNFLGDKSGADLRRHLVESHVNTSQRCLNVSYVIVFKQETGKKLTLSLRCCKKLEEVLFLRPHQVSVTFPLTSRRVKTDF